MSTEAVGMFAVVRGRPMKPWKYRMRAGLPWPAEDVRVKIVDVPCQPDAETKMATEISPSQYAELLKDKEHISVYLVNADGDMVAGDVASIEARAEVERLRAKLDGAMAELGEMRERAVSFESVSREQSAKAGARIAELEGQLAQATSQIDRGKQRRG